MRSEPTPAPEPDQPDTTALDKLIVSKMAESRAPGLVACIVRRGEIQWSRAYGMAQVADKRPCTPETPFMLGSLAQVVVAAAFMQLHEQNLVDLDDDVNEHMPFPVRHPRFPGTPITYRMLLAHTSGIQDDGRMLERHFVLGDSEVPLRKVIKWTLKTNGRHYDPIHGFSTWEPGTDYQFSNLGYALLGYLIELISDTPFDQYCTERIFKPLGMTGANWRLSQTTPETLAMPYRASRVTGEWEALGHYGYPDYPNHSLRASATELARFLAAMMNQGALDDAKVLQSQTVADMQSVCYRDFAPYQALGWFYEEQSDGATLIGHGGADHGVLHRMFYRPDRDTGVILLTNGDPSRKALWNLVSIETRLFEFSDALAAAHKPSLHVVPRVEEAATDADDAVVAFKKQGKR
jgi:CubicO group peptidase (beta-lactamase class C family)